MLPPASCRAPRPAAAAAPESLPDLHQILLLLADRSHSSLLCEISGTEYCASSSSVPCVRQESFTPGGYVCLFFFAGGGSISPTSPNFRYEKNEKRTLIGIYIHFFHIEILEIFFLKVAKLVELIEENQNFAKFISQFLCRKMAKFRQKENALANLCIPIPQ
jgi:hypothetical protein